jgi:hypothetical protein
LRRVPDFAHQSGDLVRIGYFSAAFLVAMFSLSTIAQNTKPTERKESRASDPVDKPQGNAQKSINPADEINTPTPPKSQSSDNAGAGESGPKAKKDVYSKDPESAPRK